MESPVDKTFSNMNSNGAVKIASTCKAPTGTPGQKFITQKSPFRCRHGDRHIWVQGRQAGNRATDLMRSELVAGHQSFHGVVHELGQMVAKTSEIALGPLEQFADLNKSLLEIILLAEHVY